MGSIDRQENISMVKNKILWSTHKIRWGCSPIAPPFLPPMLVNNYNNITVASYSIIVSKQKSDYRMAFVVAKVTQQLLQNIVNYHIFYHAYSSILDSCAV